MARPRPRRALRPSTPVRVARVAVPLALVGLATSGALAFGVTGGPARTAVPAAVTPVAAVVREQPVSRDLERTAAPTTPTSTPTVTPTASPTPTSRPSPATPSARPAKPSAPTPDELAAHPKVSTTVWATDQLNIRTDPAARSHVVTEVPAGTRLAATTVVRHGFRLVLFKGEGRWVSAGYVTTKKPDPATTGGVSDAPCAKGSAMEKGLTPDAVLVHRTVCARYPQVTAFGGLRGGEGFHATGQAVDCMIADPTVGWQIARWVRAHARELGVSEVIYSQHIWTVQRSSEGWRAMPDRGSRTANHYDHVHVSVYGHRAA